MMRKNELTSIRYAKTIRESIEEPAGISVKQTETTDRTIIPTTIPGNIKGLDVTDLPVEEREQIAEYHVEYAKYINQHMKSAFSFEDWLSLSKGVDFTPKWRTFKPEQTEILS